MRRLASILPAVLLLAPSAPGAAPAQTPLSPPSVSFRMDKYGNTSHERIRNTTLRTASHGTDHAMLLVVDEDVWMEAEEDGDNGQVRNSLRVQALGWDGSAFTRPLWTREEGADGWEVLSDYLRLTTIACCGRETTHTLYDLETGREVAWHTSEPLMAIDQRAESLLVLYESPRSPRAPAGADGGDVQGVLRIVRGTEVTDMVLVTGRDPGSKDDWVELRAAFCHADGRPTLRQLSGVENGRHHLQRLLRDGGPPVDRPARARRAVRAGERASSRGVRRTARRRVARRVLAARHESWVCSEGASRGGTGHRRAPPSAPAPSREPYPHFRQPGGRWTSASTTCPAWERSSPSPPTTATG